MFETKPRAKFLACFGLLAALLYAAPAAAETNTVRFSYRLTTSVIAMVKGQFGEKYGVKIKPVEFPTGIEINEGLLTGSIDIGVVGISPTSTLLTRTSGLVVVGVSDTGGGRYKTVVRKESPYKTMADLRGKKVAIKVGSGNYAAFLTYIGSQGWKESDFKVVNAGDQEAIAALTERSVDAVIYWEPVVSVLIAKGIGRPIFSFKGVVENPTFLVANRKFAESNPKTMAKFIAGFMDAQDFLTNKVPEAASMIAKAMARSGQQLDKKVIALSIPAVDYKIDLTPKLQHDLNENWQLLHSKGKLKGKEPDWSKAFDASYIEAAKKLRH